MELQKSVNFSVIKQKIIKTDEILQMYVEMSNKFKKAQQACKEIKLQYDQTVTNFSRIQLEYERYTYNLEKLKQRNDILDKENKELRDQKALLEDRYNRQTVHSQLNIQRLEEQVRTLRAKCNKARAEDASPKKKKLGKSSEKSEKQIENELFNNEERESKYVPTQHIGTQTNTPTKELRHAHIQTVETLKTLHLTESFLSENKHLRNKIHEYETDLAKLRTQKKTSSCSTQTIETETENEEIHNILKEMLTIPRLLSPITTSEGLNLTDAFSPIQTDIETSSNPSAIVELPPNLIKPLRKIENPRRFRYKLPSKDFLHLQKQHLRKIIKKRHVLNREIKKIRKLHREEDSLIKSLRALKQSKINFTISNTSILPNPEFVCVNRKSFNRLKPEEYSSEHLSCMCTNCSQSNMLLKNVHGEMQLLGFYSVKDEVNTPSNSRLDTVPDVKSLDFSLNSTRRVSSDDVLDVLAELVSRKLDGREKTTPKRRRVSSESFHSETETDVEKLFRKPDENVLQRNKMLLEEARKQNTVLSVVTVPEVDKNVEKTTEKVEECNGINDFVSHNVLSEDFDNFNFEQLPSCPQLISPIKSSKNLDLSARQSSPIRENKYSDNRMSMERIRLLWKENFNNDMDLNSDNKISINRDSVDKKHSKENESVKESKCKTNRIPEKKMDQLFKRRTSLKHDEVIKELPCPKRENIQGLKATTATKGNGLKNDQKFSKSPVKNLTNIDMKSLLPAAVLKIDNKEDLNRKIDLSPILSDIKVDVKSPKLIPLEKLNGQQDIGDFMSINRKIDEEKCERHQEIYTACPDSPILKNVHIDVDVISPKVIPLEKLDDQQNSGDIKSIRLKVQEENKETFDTSCPESPIDNNTNVDNESPIIIPLEKLDDHQNSVDFNSICLAVKENKEIFQTSCPEFPILKDIDVDVRSPKIIPLEKLDDQQNHVNFMSIHLKVKEENKETFNTLCPESPIHNDTNVDVTSPKIIPLEKLDDQVTSVNTKSIKQETREKEKQEACEMDREMSRLCPESPIFKDLDVDVKSPIIIPLENVNSQKGISDFKPTSQKIEKRLQIKCEINSELHALGPESPIDNNFDVDVRSPKFIPLEKLNYQENINYFTPASPEIEDKDQTKREMNGLCPKSPVLDGYFNVDVKSPKLIPLEKLDVLQDISAFKLVDKKIRDENKFKTNQEMNIKDSKVDVKSPKLIPLEKLDVLQEHNYFKCEIEEPEEEKCEISQKMITFNNINVDVRSPKPNNGDFKLLSRKIEKLVDKKCEIKHEVDPYCPQSPVTDDLDVDVKSPIAIPLEKLNSKQDKDDLKAEEDEEECKIIREIQAWCPEFPILDDTSVDVKSVLEKLNGHRNNDDYKPLYQRKEKIDEKSVIYRDKNSEIDTISLSSVSSDLNLVEKPKKNQNSSPFTKNAVRRSKRISEKRKFSSCSNFSDTNCNCEAVDAAPSKRLNGHAVFSHPVRDESATDVKLTKKLCNSPEILTESPGTSAGTEESKKTIVSVATTKKSPSKLKMKVLRELRMKKRMFRTNAECSLLNTDNSSQIKDFKRENADATKIRIVQNLLIPANSNHVVDLMKVPEVKRVEVPENCDNRLGSDNSSQICNFSSTECKTDEKMYAVPKKKKRLTKMKSDCDILSRIIGEMDKDRPKGVVKEKRPMSGLKRSVPDSKDEKQWREGVLVIAENIHNVSSRNKETVQDFSNNFKVFNPKSTVTLKRRILLKRLLQLSSEEKIADEIILEFKRQDVESIAEMVLQKVYEDTVDKAEDKYYPAPLMTRTQRILLELMVRLERENVENVMDTFLSKAEGFLFKIGCGLKPLIPITRLYMAVCKLRRDIFKMRNFCCNAFLFLGDFAVPLFFTVLTSWIEVLPMESNLNNYPLAKVLIQIVHLKVCNRPGYNLLPLRALISQFYGYPKERWNCDEVFEELFQQYIKCPDKSSDMAIRLLCRHKDTKWVYKKVNEFLKPLVYKIPSENVNFKATVIILLGNICRYFKPQNQFDETSVNDMRRWLIGLTEDENTDDLILRSVDLSLSNLPKKKIKVKKTKIQVIAKKTVTCRKKIVKKKKKCKKKKTIPSK